MFSNQNAAYGRGKGMRRWARRLIRTLIIGALLPCMVIVLLELGLRGAGYGVNTAPFVRISWDGAPLYLRNDAFIRQFSYSRFPSSNSAPRGTACRSRRRQTPAGYFFRAAPQPPDGRCRNTGLEAFWNSC